MGIYDERPLQIIKGFNSSKIVISEVTLIELSDEYDCGWGATYIKRMLKYYETHSLELLQKVEQIRGKY